jgi:DNA polymerase IV
MVRKIVHVDLDAFFCSVEELHDPSLRGKAFAVGGLPEERGVVASCSYAARVYGVRSAMPMARALRLCPGLKVIHGNYRAYAQASRQVLEELRSLTPSVEQISIDEAFLDLSDSPDSSQELAHRIHSIILQKLNLPCSLGVASNKLVAKIASDVGKASSPNKGKAPNAIQIVPPGMEAAFLAPLPVDVLWGVGPKTAARLAELGIHTIGDLAKWTESDLVHRFGKNGYDLFQHAHGLDNRPIITQHAAKSISQETTFSKDIRDGGQLDQALKDLSDRVALRLKKENLAGTTIKLKLRLADFTTITRQVTLNEPTSDANQIFQSVKKLLDSTWVPGQPIRLLGVGVSGLGKPIRQLLLWDSASEVHETNKDQRLRAAVKELQERYGKSILRWGIDQEDESPIS